MSYGLGLDLVFVLSCFQLICVSTIAFFFWHSGFLSQQKSEEMGTNVSSVQDKTGSRIRMKMVSAKTGARHSEDKAIVLANAANTSSFTSRGHEHERRILPRSKDPNDARFLKVRDGDVYLYLYSAFLDDRETLQSEPVIRIIVIIRTVVTWMEIEADVFPRLR